MAPRLVERSSITPALSALQLQLSHSYGFG